MSISTETVNLQVNGKTTSAYVAVPEGAGPWPGVVVIQEWWGLDEHIKDVARRFAGAGFAGAGFATIAPDLYYGEVTTEPDEARKLVMALDWGQALTAIQAAVDMLLARADVWPKKVGMIGFCMGGGLTWHAAAKLQGVGVAAPFYGGGPEMSDEEVAQIRCPLLAIFGELDQGVSPEVANRRAAQMDKAGIKHETIIYPSAQHAFFNNDRQAYHPEAAADAWQRVITLFKLTLTPAPSDEAWHEVGQQFKALGDSLVAAFNTVWHSEETQQYVAKAQANLEGMAKQLNQAAQKSLSSAEAQKVQAEAEKAAQSVKAAGRQTIEELRPHLLNAFRQARVELDEMINRLERPEKSSSDPNE